MHCVGASAAHQFVVRSGDTPHREKCDLSCLSEKWLTLEVWFPTNYKFIIIKSDIIYYYIKETISNNVIVALRNK